MNEEKSIEENKPNVPEETQSESKNDDKQKTELEKKVADLQNVVSNLNDKLLRSLAEADNLRKRNKEELEKANKYALSNFAHDLVMATENFHLAVDNMPIEAIDKCPEIKNFSDAVVMTKKELTKVFEKNGIKRLNPIGEKFDHDLHEAVAKVESDGEEGKIVKVIQAGYMINDRLIKPALVGVSYKPQAQ